MAATLELLTFVDACHSPHGAPHSNCTWDIGSSIAQTHRYIHLLLWAGVCFSCLDLQTEGICIISTVTKLLQTFAHSSSECNKVHSGIGYIFFISSVLLTLSSSNANSSVFSLL